jgi:two-component system sensor histidine kinase HydH
MNNGFLFCPQPPKPGRHNSWTILPRQGEITLLHQRNRSFLEILKFLQKEDYFVNLPAGFPIKKEPKQSAAKSDIRSNFVGIWQQHPLGARFFVVVFFIAGISLLHYFTPLNLPMHHCVYQRLYFIPLILAAFWYGFRGGMVCAIIVTLVYMTFVLFPGSTRTAMTLEQYLEILLYYVVGGVTGFLSQRERRQAHQLQQTALGLEQSYEKLSRQSERIRDMEGQLRKCERLSTIGELSAVLAHEIRNPLGSIQGTAEILKDDFQPGDRKYEFLEIMVKESKRLNKVVEDFLRLARPQPVLMGTCDLAEELQNVLSLLSVEAKKRNIALECRLDPIPPIAGDPEKLRQAFLNIVLNGLQASPQGGVVTITMAREEPEPGGTAWVQLVFSDTGPGIPEELREKIFEPFYTTKEGGTGLGLVITRKIIEAHGGSITVESAPGEGVAFRIRLPEKKRTAEKES